MNTAELENAVNELAEALNQYQRLLAYLQRTTDREDWGTHGDWGKLQRGAAAALVKAGKA